MYQPSLLIVGTRGLSEFKGMLLGSVSKYCLQHSPVPVAVVRPDDKIKKYKAKKNRLSGLMRLGSYSKSNTDESSSSDEESNASSQGLAPVDKKFNRLSFMGRRSRSPSPSPSKSASR